MLNTYLSRPALPFARPYGRLASLLCALLVLTVSHAHAQSTASEPAPPTEDASRFSLGAGLGYTFFNGAGVGVGVGGAGLSDLGSRAPYATGLVEMRVHPRWRLGAGLNGAYTHSGARSGTGFGGADQPAQSYGVGGASLSARYIINPGAVVEVSPLLALGVHAGRAKGQPAGSTMNAEGGYEPITQDTREAGVDARLGLVVEHRLLPQLWLRMESSFVSANYSQARATFRAQNQTTKSDFNQTSLAAGFSPALQLRMTFCTRI